MLNMKKYLIFLTISGIFFTISCNNFGKDFFGKKSAKEAYQDVLKKKNPVVLTAWDYAGSFALEHPHLLLDSYSEYGTTKAGIADANAFQINLKPGQRLIASYKIDSFFMPAFLEIWVNDVAGKKLLASADSLLKIVNYFSKSGGNYIVKFQPKMEVNINFELVIQIAAGLDFPIDSKSKSNIGSLWGDPRDGGVRKHEGIDIFAAKGSNILAEADGTIAYIDETEIGGKVVSLRPKSEDFTIYHAHLDEQKVKAGDIVSKGQIIGTVGNTGNAKTTAPHLHLGIYGRSGAVDPLYFVKKTAIVISPKPKKLLQSVKLGTTATLYAGPDSKNPYNIKTGFIATSEAITNGFYRVKLKDGSKGFVKESDFKKANSVASK